MTILRMDSQKIDTSCGGKPHGTDDDIVIPQDQRFFIGDIALKFFQIFCFIKLWISVNCKGY